MNRRRLLAFVSSRMQELASERQAVKSELDKLHVDSWVFETDAGARSQTIQETYLKEIESADLYIGIFWKGYGDYTIEEYEHAVKLGKSCLIYEKRSALEGRDPRLQTFLDRIGRVETGLTIRWFQTPDQLGAFVQQDVAAWQTDLVRSAKPRGYAAPFQAPALTDQYVERASMLDSLRKTLLPVGDNESLQITRAVLHGIGGVGKTTVAAAFARTEVVRERFRDGILWVTLGQNPDIAQRLSDWGRALNDPELPTIGYVNHLGGTNRLRTLLSDKACLLVVDDAWQAAHARSFLVGGPRCLLLITTRLSEIGEQIGASQVELNEMTPAEARSLVEKWSGGVEDVDRESAEWLMRQVGYLPLALELIGAQVKKLGWKEYRERWGSQKLKAIRRGRRSQGKEDNLWDSLELSVAALAPEDRARYFSLGVFEEDTPFPANACAALWGCSEDDAADLLIDLTGQALLRTRSESASPRYVFHDLFHEFVIEQLGKEGRTKANRTLIEGYRVLCHGEWANGPDDGYFFEHLAQHLVAAGQVAELYAVVDNRWLETQFRRSHSHRAFASDLGQVLGAAATETPPNLLQIVRATFIRSTLGSLATRADAESLAALARIGSLEMARGHADLVPEPAKRSRTYRLIAQEVLARGEVAEAQRLLRQALSATDSIDPQHYRSKTLSDLVEVMVDAGDVAKARSVAADAERTARSEAHEHFRSDLMLRAARAHARAGNAQQSSALAGDALTVIEREDDRVRKLALLVRLEAVFAMAGNADRAGEISAKGSALFEEINRDIGTTDDFSHIYAGDLSEAFLEAGDVDSAAIISERWVGRSWKGVSTLAGAAAAFIAAGEAEQGRRLADQSAEIVLELLKEEQHSFNANERIEGLGRVTAALTRAGRGDKAIEFAGLAAEPEARSHSFGTVALALAQAGQVGDARQAAEASLAASQRLIKDDQRVSAWLTAAARALNAVGSKASAIERANRALQLSENWKADRRDGENMRVLARVLADLGEPAKALSVIDRMEDAAKEAEALIELIRSRGDDPTQARAWADRAMELVRGEQASSVAVLGAAADALANTDLKAEAVKFARLAVQRSANTDDSSTDDADGLSAAAQAFARLGRFEEAQEAAEKISPRKQANASRTLARKARALESLAAALEDAGEHERAVAAANAALGAARDAAGNATDLYTFGSEALNIAAKALARVGDNRGAQAASRAALDLARGKLSGGA